MVRRLLDAGEGAPPELRTDSDRLEQLVGDWQLIADLSFADLLLWLPDRQPEQAAEGTAAAAAAPSTPAGEGLGFSVAAHCRPTTGSTLFPMHVVGRRAQPRELARMQECLETAEVFISPEDGSDFSHAEFVPVVRDGRAIAVLTRHTEASRRRGLARLERNYRSCASSLLGMIAEGSFPPERPHSRSNRGEPRVGDGLVVLNREGRVRYASPNGISVIYRMGHEGDIEGRYLADLVSELMDGGHEVVDESLPLVLTGRTSWRTDVDIKHVSVSLRSVPFLRDGNRTGAVVLLRDVTEIRRQERELLSRDAMIREMHHRVKNNLQTVSALLRLQARRATSDEAKGAIEEAMRRVSAIAIVHDALSQSADESLDFDDIIDKGLKLAPAIASPHTDVVVTRDGEFGTFTSADATSLLLAITELVTNALEHGYGDPESLETAARGRVSITPTREAGRLRVVIADDGAGIGDEGPGSGLGTQIVRTLITSDMRGTIEWNARPEGGTEVVIDVPLRSAPR